MNWKSALAAWCAVGIVFASYIVWASSSVTTLDVSKNKLGYQVIKWDFVADSEGDAKAITEYPVFGRVHRAYIASSINNPTFTCTLYETELGYINTTPYVELERHNTDVLTCWPEITLVRNNTAELKCLPAASYLYFDLDATANITGTIELIVSPNDYSYLIP